MLEADQGWSRAMEVITQRGGLAKASPVKN
jgi:hypothetical protein